MPVGTHGKINVKRDGKSWMASCQFRDLDGVVRKVRAWDSTKDKARNTLREKLRDQLGRDHARQQGRRRRPEVAE